MFDKANEALKNWKSLLPMLRPLIKNETKNAVRRKKMNVATAPNGTTIGVTDPADTTVINIPYQPACANVTVGQSVWVEWLYDNFSTAIAVTPGDGIVKNITLQDGNYYIYDSNGVRRVTISSSGNIMLRNGNGDTTVLIRGDGSLSSNPLPVSQGGTGRTNGGLPYRGITTAPTDSGTAFFFRANANITMMAWDDTANAVTIPNFTHGVFIASSDAVMIGYDSNNNMYVAYRNNGTWRGKVIPSDPSVEYKLVQARYPASGTQTFAVGSSYNVSVTVPSGYAILAEQPVKTSGFVGAFETPNVNFMGTGTQTYTFWCAVGGTGYLTFPVVCVKKH